MATNRLARTMHDVGLAAWFGGGLMGVVGVNGASSELSSAEGLRMVNSAWGRWTPVNLLSIAAHLAGGTALTWGNKSRIGKQRGVASATAVKGALTLGALGVTAYSRTLGQKLMEYEASEAQRDSFQSAEPPVADPLTPAEKTPEEIAAAQRQLTVLQWLLPALTGSLVVLQAVMGEQQRPTEVARGFVQRLLPWW